MPKLNLRDVEDILDEEQEDSNEFMDDPEYEGSAFYFIDRYDYPNDEFPEDEFPVDNNDYDWAFDWEDQLDAYFMPFE